MSRKEVKETIENAVVSNKPFWILTIAAIILIFASFVVPPLGMIDSSVLAAVGELAGFGALWTIIFAIQKGVDASVTHNDTEITIGDLKEKRRIGRRRNRFEDYSYGEVGPADVYFDNEPEEVENPTSEDGE